MMRSQKQQAVHYFSRPHKLQPPADVQGPAAWKAPIGDQLDRWSYRFSNAEIEELEKAASKVVKSGLPLTNLTAKEFELPTLSKRLGTWSDQVNRGLGFVRLRGLPVTEWGAELSKLMYWGMAMHLGIPGSQNPQGDILGDVKDLRKTGKGRFYETNKDIAFHCDAADIVGLLCLQAAKEGGLSRIASSTSIYNEIVSSYPHLVEAFFMEFPLDTHGEGNLDFIPIKPAAYDGQRLRIFYHSDYFRSGANLPNAPSLHDKQIELLDVIDSLAMSPEFYLDMELEPGDIQLISNHTVIHSRTAYTDFDELEKRRHLLRLWLSNAEEYRGHAVSKWTASLAFQAGLAWRMLSNS